MVSDNKTNSFNDFITELKNSDIVKEKVKSKKSKSLHFWNTDSILKLYNDLVSNKVVFTFPLSDVEDKKNNKVIKGLISRYNLLNGEYKGIYPAYDLKILLDDLCSKNNLLTCINMSKNNKMGMKSWLKVDYSQKVKK